MRVMLKLGKPAKLILVLARWFCKMLKNIGLLGKFKIQRRNLLASAAIAIFAPIKSNAKDKKILRFIVMGDWGRYGTPQQKAVANAMSKAATQKPCDFIIAVGDNFYDDGVLSLDDTHWRKSFENVYNAPSLQKNWYVALGNHDYGGNPQIQVEYSKISKIWKMPVRYYKIPQYAPNIDIFVLDTTPIVWENDNPSLERRKKLAGQDVKKQLRWIENELKSSRAATKIVIGHHTIFSGGKEHGDGNEMIAHVLPILKKYNVKAYINGHDHDLQYIVRDGFSTITSGAASDTRDVKPVNGTKFCKSELGFVMMEIEDSEIRFQFINAENKILYENKI